MMISTEEENRAVQCLHDFINYFNKKVPYKISAIFNERKVSLIFFSKYTGYLKKIYCL